MNEETLFAEALQRSDPAQRAAFLEQACGADAELRRRIEELLRAHDQAGGLLDKPVATLEGTSDAPPGQWLDPDKLPETPPEGVGSRIKQYKLLQQIGEGGMGVVFMAEQQEPVRRMVALKVIKAGMDSAQVIARFEQERQALALMDHPNIAKVLDAGTTASGRPFFVMELVKGIPITKYCDEQRLSPKQRLELFVPVCQAIQHAHQKGIIHRDIKPSNVLIAAYDGKPVPKVIDFGVAKATGGKLTERTLFTGFGGLVGTLEYMSPEQAEFNALDIDTRSDVYSLGVLLYELLTGSTPLTRQRIKDAAILEVLRLIREEEPPRPSTRLSDSKDSLASVSAQRHSEPPALVKAIRGEVDWIVMKALEKDRTRRYETANGLARDIQRYLAEEAVEAGPPSARYRLRKLAWKHRRGLATAAVLLVLLIAAVVVSSSLALWAVNEHNHARVAEAEAKQQRDQAEAAEADTKAVLEFFQDKVLSAGCPEGQEGGQGPKVTLRQAVDAAESSIAKAFADRPLVEASIRKTLGSTYHFLGEYRLAIHQHERELALRTAHQGSDHPDTLTSMGNLGLAYQEAGRGKDSLPLLEKVLAIRKIKLGLEHPDTLQNMNNLAVTYSVVGQPQKALLLFEETLNLMKTTEHPTTIITMRNLSGTYREVGRMQDALALGKETLKLCKAKHGPNHPHTLHCMHNLALTYQAAGQLQNALPLCEQTLELRKLKLGPNHPDTLTSMSDLACSYQQAGRGKEALPLMESALVLRKSQLGPKHPATLESMHNLAAIYHHAGRLKDAVPLYEETLKLSKLVLGTDHPDTLRTMQNLAAAYGDAERMQDSLTLLQQTLELMKATLPPQHPSTLTCMNLLARAYWLAGQLDRSIPLLEETLKQHEAKFAPDHPETLTAMANLGVNYRDGGRTKDALPLIETALRRGRQRPGGLPASLAWLPSELAETYDRDGQFAKAEPIYRDALEQMRRQFGDDDPGTAGHMARLSFNLLRQKKHVEAEPLLRGCLKVRAAKQPDGWNTFNTQSMLGEALLGQKKFTDAEPLLLAGYQGMKQREEKIPPHGKVRVREALERLVRLYEATDKKDAAEKWRKELAASKTADKK